jgi:hypothetical protein
LSLPEEPLQKLKLYIFLERIRCFGQEQLSSNHFVIWQHNFRVSDFLPINMADAAET